MSDTMTTITANVPDELSDKLKQFIEELGGEILVETTSSLKEVVLSELEEGLSEAKSIQEGKKAGMSLAAFLKDE
jgi:hypothetical protein